MYRIGWWQWSLGVICNRVSVCMYACIHMHAWCQLSYANNYNIYKQIYWPTTDLPLNILNIQMWTGSCTSNAYLPYIHRGFNFFLWNSTGWGLCIYCEIDQTLLFYQLTSHYTKQFQFTSVVENYDWMQPKLSNAYIKNKRAYVLLKSIHYWYKKSTLASVVFPYELLSCSLVMEITSQTNKQKMRAAS